MTASLTLSAFGQAVASSGSSTSAYQYGATSGYRTEGDAGLTLVGCRFYDAQVGRFLTRDTDLDEAPYVYCDGDPINLVDVDGHAPHKPPTKPKPPKPPKPQPEPQPPAWWPDKIEAGIEPGGIGGKITWDGDKIWHRMSPKNRAAMKTADDVKDWVKKGGKP